MRPTTQDIRDARERGEAAFFAALAQAFPEIKTGDLPPDISERFSTACADVAIAWIESNEEPALTHDQLQGLARFADDLSKGAHSEEVSSVMIQLRHDRCADLWVNGKQQDFAMDEHGDPVQL